MSLSTDVNAMEEWLIRVNNTPNPNYDFIFPFETGRLKFVLNDAIVDYPFIAYVVGFVYLFLIFLIQWLMKDLKAFSLRKVSFCWNTLLVVVSIVICARVLPHLLFVLQRESFFVSLCTDRSFIYDEVCGTWLILFPFIKILELGDTFILVLQKRHLDPYYWCHHLLAVLGSWYMYPTYPAISVWLCLIISASHIPLYSYTAVRSINLLPISPYVPLLLIFSELLTVFSGASLSVLVLYYQSMGKNCNLSVETTIILIVLFSSCVVLLNLLFYRRKKFLDKKTSTIKDIRLNV